MSRGYRGKKPRKPSRSGRSDSPGRGRQGRGGQDRKVLRFLSEEARKPLRIDEIARGLGSGWDQEDLRSTLEGLTRSGKVIRIKGDRYALPGKIHVVTGRIRINEDGFGSLTVEGGEGAIQIPPARLGGAMDGDTVVVRPEGRGRRGMPAGRVIRIVERGREVLVAVFDTGPAISVARPYGFGFDRPVVIPPGKEMGAAADQLVLVKIMDYPTRAHPALGEVVELLGEPDSPSAQTMAVVHSHSLPYVFSAAVLREAAAFHDEPAEGDLKGRQDLRHLPFVTIDGVNARDFDDALCATAGPEGGTTLHVAIADVSHYVVPGSALDREAAMRGNSVYFPDMVIPMLPEHLSNNLCSLRPGEDRLAMVCRVEVGPGGDPGESALFPAVIRSAARLTYRETEDHITGQAPSDQICGPVVQNISALMSLYETLDRRRRGRHSLDFDFPEPQVVLSATGHVENILRSSRYTSHRLVEECMLLANEVVARFMREHEAPGVYRVHEPPGEERIMELNRQLAALGEAIGRGQLKDPSPFSAILQRAHGTVRERFLNTIILRAMMRAHYAPEPEGHFALALSDYTHFTSPIRRYADLMVHRVVKGVLGTAPPYEPGDREEICQHISETEQVSETAQRDLLAFLRALFMEDKVGEEFTAVVSGVTPFGLFVELDEYFIEGLVHMSALHDDYYVFRDDNLTLTGEHTGRVYRIGDAVPVKLLSVDLERRYIDFEPAEEEG